MTDVLAFIEGPLGRIRLNRPKALHALNHAMCTEMLGALDRWAGDTAVASAVPATRNDFSKAASPEGNVCDR